MTIWLVISDVFAASALSLALVRTFASPCPDAESCPVWLV